MERKFSAKEFTNLYASLALLQMNFSNLLLANRMQDEKKSEKSLEEMNSNFKKVFEIINKKI